MLKMERTATGYQLSGEIDEASDFSGLPDEPMELDLGRIRRINSTGVRNWIRWKDARTHMPVLVNVPAPMVIELSLIREFGTGLSVRSVRAPYFDPCTGGSSDRLIDARMLLDVRASRSVPKIFCENAGEPLEFDEDETNFFGFVFHEVTLIPST